MSSQKKDEAADANKVKDDEEKKENGDSKEDGKKGKNKVKYGSRDLPISATVNELSSAEVQKYLETEVSYV